MSTRLKQDAKTAFGSSGGFANSFAKLEEIGRCLTFVDQCCSLKQGARKLATWFWLVCWQTKVVLVCQRKPFHASCTHPRPSVGVRRPCGSPAAQNCRKSRMLAPGPCSLPAAPAQSATEPEARGLTSRDDQNPRDWSHDRKWAIRTPGARQDGKTKTKKAGTAEKPPPPRDSLRLMTSRWTL